MPFIQLQFRRDTSNNWSNTDPILASGELAIEVDTNLFKIGDGRTSWRKLPYGGLQGPRGPVGGSAGGPYYIEASYSTGSNVPFAAGTSANNLTSYLPPSYSVALSTNYISITNSNVTTANSWQLSVGPIGIQYMTGNQSITTWLTAQTWGYNTPSANVVTISSNAMKIDSTFINLTGVNGFSGAGDGNSHVMVRIGVQPYYFT